MTTTVNVLSNSVVVVDVSTSTYILLVPPTGGTSGTVSLNGANCSDGQIVTVATEVAKLASPLNKINAIINTGPYSPATVRFGQSADDNQVVTLMCDQTGAILGNSSPAFYATSYVKP